MKRSARALRGIDYETTSGGETTMQHAASPLKRHNESHHDRGPIPAPTRTRTAITPARTTIATRPTPPPGTSAISPPPQQQQQQGQRFDSGRGLKRGVGPQCAATRRRGPDAARTPSPTQVPHPAGAAIAARAPTPARIPSPASATATHPNPATPVADRIDRDQQPARMAASRPRPDPHRSVADRSDRDRQPTLTTASRPRLSRS